MDAAVVQLPMMVGADVKSRLPHSETLLDLEQRVLRDVLLHKVDHRVYKMQPILSQELCIKVYPCVPLDLWVRQPAQGDKAGVAWLSLFSAIRRNTRSTTIAPDGVAIEPQPTSLQTPFMG